MEEGLGNCHASAFDDSFFSIEQPPLSLSSNTKMHTAGTKCNQKKVISSKDAVGSHVNNVGNPRSAVVCNRCRVLDVNASALNAKLTLLIVG